MMMVPGAFAFAGGQLTIWASGAAGNSVNCVSSSDGASAATAACRFASRR